MSAVMMVLDFIHINENSRIPKYKQIVDSIIHNISSGNLKVGERIPSINQFSEEFLLSRDTVEKAYNILKEKKVITSVRGKGYYITRTNLISKLNVLFLINKLSSYKLKIYNSFVNSIGNNGHTDLHIYHCDQSLFLNLLSKNRGGYDYYVIMPHFRTDDSRHTSFTAEVQKAVEQIPRNKLVLMDNKLQIEGATEIYQDFENDIYDALKAGLHKIKKYNNLVLAYPAKSIYPYPKRILNGFRKFCVEFNFEFEVIDQIYDDMILKQGDLFITIEESDLVNIVKQIRGSQLEMGKNIGMISYNDTPLKELLGITVISTDFVKMGETAAEMILNNNRGSIKNPFNFINRNSI